MGEMKPITELTGYAKAARAWRNIAVFAGVHNPERAREATGKAEEFERLAELESVTHSSDEPDR